MPRLAQHLIALFVCVSSAAPAALAADPQSPADAKSTPTFIYGGRDAFPPYEYLDKSGRATGFNVELVREIGRIAGVRVGIRLGPLRTIMRSLEKGEVDFMSMAYSDARADRYSWLERTWTHGQALVFRAGRANYPSELDDLDEEVVAIEEGSLMHELLRDLPEVRRPVLLLTPNQKEALRLVARGDASATAGNWLTLQTAADDLDASRLVFNTTKALSYHFVTRRGLERRLAWLAPALATARGSGVFDRLVERHLVVVPTEQALRRYAGYGVMALGSLVAIALGFVVWNRSLRKQVRARHAAAERTMRLQTITAALAEAMTPTGVAAVVVEQGAAGVGAQAGIVSVLSADERKLHILKASGYAPAALEPMRDLPMGSPVPVARAAVGRTPVLIRDPAPDHCGGVEPLAGVARAVAAVPMLVGGRSLGAICFAFTSPQVFGQDDEAMLMAIARQAGLAFERARLYEAERVARAEAEAASRAKDEFLATLSHELRTPLNAILGWSHMLRTGVLDEEKAGRALETIERNARVQMQLIGDLLDISRTVMGNLQLDVQPVNVLSSIEAALEAVRPAAHAKGILLRSALPRGRVLVDGDPARLQQIFWNLLSNAIKFTPAGGRVEVQASAGVRNVTVRVRDTGVGIPREGLPHIFDRFYQGDASTTRAHGGLGLGLAIVRHLVELHGGVVHADSAGPGMGCVFTVTLPVPARQASAPAQVVSASRRP